MLQLAAQQTWRRQQAGVSQLSMLLCLNLLTQQTTSSLKALQAERMVRIKGGAATLSVPCLSLCLLA